MTTEHIYTAGGHQRAIHNLPVYGETVAYAIERHDAAANDQATYVEMTDDADHVVRSGKASWHRVEGDKGYLTGATAIRLANGCSGWVKLYVGGLNGPDAGCVGELTRINAVLASVNADLRFCAAVA
ncbi:hypothetical protein [Mesorhizobium sp. BR-1-1-10]|uniref:hypothetical protein n=1 Tax=Mesorhizobium sp. BR-1-1-10 TaxID=2876660 RepID=UPI001CD16955|nr:hypothetical protein [Mesorhizobium sp. BR-1-1-10]MBZ9975519.1 hypothetical protein [Mesorhizobium sp. BR-1-1-10]